MLQQAKQALHDEERSDEEPNVYEESAKVEPVDHGLVSQFLRLVPFGQFTHRLPLVMHVSLLICASIPETMGSVNG